MGRVFADRFASIAARRKGSDGERMTFFEASEVADALLSGLHHLHRKGVVHTQISPHTVWEMQQPSPVVLKILDFSAARVPAAASPGSSSLSPEARTLVEQAEEDTDSRINVFLGESGVSFKKL